MTAVRQHDVVVVGGGLAVAVVGGPADRFRDGVVLTTTEESSGPRRAVVSTCAGEPGSRFANAAWNSAGRGTGWSSGRRFRRIRCGRWHFRSCTRRRRASVSRCVWRSPGCPVRRTSTVVARAAVPSRPGSGRGRSPRRPRRRRRPAVSARRARRTSGRRRWVCAAQRCDGLGEMCGDLVDPVAGLVVGVFAGVGDARRLSGPRGCQGAESGGANLVRHGSHEEAASQSPWMNMTGGASTARCGVPACRAWSRVLPDRGMCPQCWLSRCSPHHSRKSLSAVSVWTLVTNRGQTVRFGPFSEIRATLD